MKLSSKKALAQIYDYRKKSCKSIYSTSKSLTLSTSAYLIINKDHFDKSDSISSSKIESQQSNQKNQIQTIIINGDDFEEKIQDPNQTSSFIPITPSNKISSHNESHFDDLSKNLTDKFTFNNNDLNSNNNNSICDESEDRISKINNLSLDNNLNRNNYNKNKSIFSKNNSLKIKKNNSNYIFDVIKKQKERNKENDKRNLSLDICSNFSDIEDSEENIINLKHYSDLESKDKINLKKIIPLYSKKLKLKKFNEYIALNKPVIFDKCTDNNIIYGFSALTFKNDSINSKTKISININYSNEHGNFNFFSLYNPLITSKVLEIKYNELSMNNIFINKNILQDIFGDIILLNFHNSTFSIYNNLKPKLNKFFSYQAIFSIDNSKNIKKFNQAQKIRIQKNFDFIILLNKGIFNCLNNKEICKIIYESIKNCIINKNNFSYFLDQSIKNIFENVIKKNGQKDMAYIFICLNNLYNLFENKNIHKIDEILNFIENTTYKYDEEYDDGVYKNINDDSYKDSIYYDGIINKNSNISLSFKEKNININDEYFDKKKTNHQKIKKRNFLNCCGFFV